MCDHGNDTNYRCQCDSIYPLRRAQFAHYGLTQQELRVGDGF